MLLGGVLGGQNVAISLVLAMFFEKGRFPQVRPSASLECLGGLLGWLWRSGVLLGGVLGGQNVVILFVLDGFL